MVRRQKTKTVCTIGPSTEEAEVMEAMMRAGMDVARLNFSHGDFSYHGTLIKRLRSVAAKIGHPITIMADLPGPKMRIGTFAREPVQLLQGGRFLLTALKIEGDETTVYCPIPELFEAVRPGHRLFLNDGMIELEVEQIRDSEIECKIVVGGVLRSRKGLNAPYIDLGASAFTARDRECLEFALANGVDAVSQSFVGSAEDVMAVRKAAEECGGRPFVIAKIERADVLDRLDEVIEAADGIMIARGDLGVEIPIEEIAVIQKRIAALARRRGRPVITATQMLESMTRNIRPTRAEATDVANAIIDGTDAVMLSEESAMGKYPVEALKTLIRIAIATESMIDMAALRSNGCNSADGNNEGAQWTAEEAVARAMNILAMSFDSPAIICPTDSGATARRIARFRMPQWIVAMSQSKVTLRGLSFSYGVLPLHIKQKPSGWNDMVKQLVRELGISGGRHLLLIEGPSKAHPNANHRIEMIPFND